MASGPLDKNLMFQLILEEAFGDGALSADEQRLIMAVTQLLQIPPDDHRRLFADTERRFKAGELEREGDLDREALYRRLVQAARADGTIEAGEHALLDQLADFLELSDEERARAEAP